MLPYDRLFKSSVQSALNRPFDCEIESELDGLAVIFIHKALRSPERPACYCGVRVANAINHDELR